MLILTRRIGEALMIGDDVVITQAKEVDEIMKKVPKGKLTTINEICKKLAKKHNVKFCCTLTTGIFITTAANAVEEIGGKNKTPYWRTLKNGGFLNEKYPGGMENQKKLLEKEGHKVIPRGGKYSIMNYEDRIY